MHCVDSSMPLLFILRTRTRVNGTKEIYENKQTITQSVLFIRAFSLHNETFIFNYQLMAIKGVPEKSLEHFIKTDIL